MKNTIFLIALALAASAAALGQTPASGQAQAAPTGRQEARPPAVPQGRPFTDGPVWRINYLRTKPGKNADHMRWLREYRRRILDGQKAEGLILDYKYFVKPTSDGPNDWDIAEAVLYKNYGDHLDFSEERSSKAAAVGMKVFGSDENRLKLWAELRDASREVVSSQVMRELTLRPPDAPRAGNQ